MNCTCFMFLSVFKKKFSSMSWFYLYTMIPPHSSQNIFWETASIFLTLSLFSFYDTRLLFQNFLRFIIWGSCAVQDKWGFLKSPLKFDKIYSCIIISQNFRHNFVSFYNIHILTLVNSWDIMIHIMLLKYYQRISSWWFPYTGTSW